jgi:glyoxylase-like metal-dependent hydrolase (beta-lactamase superfamily II)
VIEIVPGIYQIETEMGDNRLCLYLLRGEQTLLIDSGMAGSPAGAVYPALAAAGLPLQIDLLLVSHADADHHGGNAAIRAGSPGVTILCHELDRQRVESKANHLRGRYADVVAADDVVYPPELMTALSDMIGPDTPVTLGLRGGETLALGGGRTYQALHTPGHTAGHLSIWDPERRVLIIQDAVLWRGVPDRAGVALSPPPYYDAGAYVETIRRLRVLEPAWLLTAHYPLIKGRSVDEFFAASLDFVAAVDRAVLEVVDNAHRPLSLSAVIDAVDARLGPFAVAIQWVGPVLAHLRRHVAERRLREDAGGDRRYWAPMERKS